MSYKIDILAIGAHPDDIELGAEARSLNILIWVVQLEC